MSADNYLGIWKYNPRLYKGYNCWSEEEAVVESDLTDRRVIFTARSLRQAIIKAQQALGEDIFEYGYRFLNC